MKFKLGPLFDYTRRDAVFDDERVYRYLLTRSWGAPLLARLVLWIMLNPSTADEWVLDPTLRRCQDYSSAWGYDGFQVVNLFALRSTDPAALPKHPNPIGPLNNESILGAAAYAPLIICAWGGEAFARDRSLEVLKLLRGRTLHYLKLNGDGTPAHPLYLKKILTPTRWHI